MTPLSAKLRALHEAATPGPWLHHSDDGVRWDTPRVVGHDYRPVPNLCDYYCTGPRVPSSEAADKDGSLIVALRNALPALADLIEAAEAMANADERPFSTRAMRIEKIRAALARLDEVMR